MSTEDRNRGSETIRVFHLNCGPLRGARHKAIRKYLDKNVGILDLLMECEDADRFRFIDEEFEATRWEPHWTTIRHFFERQN